MQASSALLDDADLLDHIHRIHKPIGYTRGATHSEFRLTPAGPRLVEINARLGGDLIPYLGVLAIGTDPAVAAAQVMVGRAPDTAPRHRRTAGIRFLYPTEDCEVVSAAVREDRLGPGIHL